MMGRQLMVSAGWAGVCLLAGCSGGPTIPETVPASGVVLYQEKPVAGAEVTFSNTGEAGRAARGQTDDQGKFQLSTYIDPQNNPQGAMPGDYQVTVSKKDRPAGQMTPDQMQKAMQSGQQVGPPKDMLPAKYANPKQSGLIATVKKGEKNDSFKFDLTD